MDNNELLHAITGIAGMEANPSPDELLANLSNLEQANAKIHGMLITARMKQLMQDFGERETDIYVVTFPKSGTTLMQMLLYQLTTDGDMSFEHLYDVSPWCRHSAFFNRDMASVGERRIIKTHDGYELLRDIKKGKFIFVVRDCLDVISSLHEHIKDYNNPNVDFNELNERKMKEWMQYNSEWARNENGLDIMYVHYEELITDKQAVTAKIAAFAGIQITDEIMARVLERTSFSFMKKHEAKFGEQPEHWKVYNNFIRKGKAGEGKEKFTTEQIEKYNNMIAEYSAGNKLISSYIK